MHRFKTPARLAAGSDTLTGLPIRCCRIQSDGRRFMLARRMSPEPGCTEVTHTRIALLSGARKPVALAAYLHIEEWGWSFRTDREMSDADVICSPQPRLNARLGSPELADSRARYWNLCQQLQEA